ncbi:MAG TPA: hypothetical protein PLY70_07485 [Saprospiraceae bacterium]|nr:hypothetical protein [Saprospiraceae bacterium]
MKLIGLTKDKDILFVQAYLLLAHKGVKINEVSYIRTVFSDKKSGYEEFWKSEQVTCHVDHILSNGIINNEEDYQVIEEEIYQFYLSNTKEEQVYVFIAGGHTLLNIAIQKAAYLFGAKDSFQMLVNVPRDEEPKTIEDVKKRIETNDILYASVGYEPGWNVLKTLILKKNISHTIKSITKNLESRNVSDINEYPFECLNLLPVKAIEWLRSRSYESDRDWITNLPKVELHCHLGGFATTGSLLTKVRLAADNSYDIGQIKNIEYPKDWPLTNDNLPLDNYMFLGDNNGSYILKNIGCLREQVSLLYDHFLIQNIRYAEVRCSPLNYVSDDYSATEILSTIVDTFNFKMNQANKAMKSWCHVNLIIIATRRQDKDMSKIDANLSLAINSESASKKEGRCKIVGVDLAGFENKKTRAELYEANFKPINRAGIAITVHAGENDDSEGIWQAVFKLSARRLGHALNLYQDSKLLKSIVNRNIGIEMCPYANYQIKGFYPKQNTDTIYPLINYLNAGARVTINTDNIGISQATLTDNFLLASVMNPDLTRMNILQLIRNGLEVAFIDRDLKIRLIKMFNQEIFDLLHSNELLQTI